MAGAVETPRRRAHGKRFVLANLVVVAGFLAVLGLFAFLVQKGTSNRWSSYEPQGIRWHRQFERTANQRNFSTHLSEGLKVFDLMSGFMSISQTCRDVLLDGRLPAA